MTSEETRRLPKGLHLIKLIEKTSSDIKPLLLPTISVKEGLRPFIRNSSIQYYSENHESSGGLSG